MKKTLISLLIFIIGTIVVGIAVFATEIGIDHNSQWGKGRIIGLICGIIVIISAFIVFFCFNQIAIWMQNNLTKKGISQLLSYFADHRMKLIYLSAGLIGIAIAIIYVWFISVGTWTNWSKTNDYRGGYYDQLGTAFDRGQLYIQTRPDPAILSLPNPYDPFARKKLPNNETLKKDIFDLSLYNGKFYLYWGPVPAVMIALIKPFVSVEVSDPYLVFAFILSLFIFQSLLLIKIWSRFFNHLPAWTILLILFLGGLVNPIPFMLSQPRIYEAAIACGQLFLVGGIYFAYTALDRFSPSKLYLAMCSIFWACAVGSRAFLLIPIAFLFFMVIIGLVKYHFQQKIDLKAMPAILALCLPLILGGVALGWYNWARFGSVFELGFKYQITMVDFNKYYNEIFSLAYVPANIYVYLFNRPEITNLFPFIKPGLAGDSSFLYNHLPAHYTAEHIIGPIYAAPFMVFGIVSILTMSSQRLQENLSKTHNGQRLEFYRWLLSSLIGSLPFATLSLLLFFYAAQRYLEDIMPSIFLIAAFGFWQGYSLLNKNLLQRIFYSLVAAVLIGISAITSILLYFSGDILRIKSTNPALLSQLILFFMKITRGHIG